MSAVRKLRYKFRKYILHKQKVNPISDSDNDNRNKPPFVSVAIKVRAEQTCLFCRTAATKRIEAHLKGGLGWIVYMSGGTTNRELNLPRIASQSVLGLNRRRLGIVNMFTLLSTCTIFLCYTEQ